MKRGVAIAVALGIAAAVGLIGLTRWHATGPALIGGPFSLIDGAGHAVTERDFRGRWMLVYFGYTHCPDACPTTLSDLGAALDRLPSAQRARFVPIFITVDPARDTPSVMGAYVHAFGPDFVGLSGSDVAVAAAAHGYRVYAQKHPGKGGDYSMDHSSLIYVMDPAGNFSTVIGDNSAPPAIAAQLIQLLK